MRNSVCSSRGLAISGGIASSVVASLVYPYIVYFLTKEQGYTLTEAASLLGLATVINVIVRVIAARLIDNVQLYRLAGIGLLLALGLPVSLVWYPEWAAVLVGLVAYTAGAVLFSASMTLAIYSTEESKVDQKINFSYYYAASNLFLGLAPVGIFYLAAESYKTVFISAICLQIISIICVQLLIRRAPVAQVKSSRPASMMESYSSLLTKEFAVIFIIGCGYSCIYQQLTTNISVLLKDTRVWGREVYPLLIAVNGLLIVAIQPMYVRMLKILQERDFLIPGVGVLLASFACLTLPVDVIYSLIPFALLFTLAEFIINLSLTDNIIALAPLEARGTWITCFALSRMAGAVGVPLGSVIIETYGASSYLWALLLLCAVILFLTFVNYIVRRDSLRSQVDETSAC